MIRIYLDWNVISNLKKVEYQHIKQFIDTNKKHLLFLYSPAHFTDLMKSYNPNNTLFNEDLNTLEYLSEKHHIQWSKEGVEYLLGTPKEYFEGEKDKETDFSKLMDIETMFEKLGDDSNALKNLTDVMKLLFQMQPTGIEITDENRDILKMMFPSLTSNSSMWDFMKDLAPFTQNLLKNGEYYKDFRKTIGDKGFKLEAKSGDWNYQDVIVNIDKFLADLGTGMTFLEFVKQGFKHRKEPMSFYEYYITAYLMLDIIGYKKDRLPKGTDNMQNIQADAEHSFYAAHCDFLVAEDKKLRIKSEVLYNKFNV
jgi:hypothetical protein